MQSQDTQISVQHWHQLPVHHQQQQRRHVGCRTPAGTQAQAAVQACVLQQRWRSGAAQQQAG
jgi:hypothetical protein